jgi:hypothetical protein
MAFEDYIRDLSYLLSGNLSDFTLNFGSKIWRVHQALTVCHSVVSKGSYDRLEVVGLDQVESGHPISFTGKREWSRYLER